MDAYTKYAAFHEDNFFYGIECRRAFSDILGENLIEFLVFSIMP